ncbi:MAG: amino acid permease, partial [Saprospiraceae bacterium]|nr:amino acid permease [Saprospiraceae bacterium]
MKNIPKAIFWSMGIVSILYVLVVLVILASNLTEYNEAAMGIAAKKFLGAIGGMVIVAGGIFSMISASNASIMAGSRVALAMSELGHLPEELGKIHPQRGTPWIAVMAVGGLIMIFTILLPLEDLAHFADTVLLFALIMVNLALIWHRRRFPHLPRPFKVPFYPLTPIVGVLANLYLLFQLLHHPVSLSLALFTLVLCAAGFLYWKGSLPDEEGFEGVPSKVVQQSYSPDEAQKSKTFLVPVSSLRSAPMVLQFAIRIAQEQDASITVLKVVEYPESRPLEFGINDFAQEKQLLREVQLEGVKHGVNIGTMLRVGYSTARAILESAREVNANLILMHWKGSSTTSDKIMSRIIDVVATHAKRDVAIFR